MAYKRRTRYTATLMRGGQTTQRDILAYSPDSVRDWYTARGYTVVNIASGRKPAPRRNAPVSWRLDNRRLQEAIDFLGLSYPVTIKQTRVEGGRRGAYRTEWSGPGVISRNNKWYGLRGNLRARPSHHITIKSWLDPEQASRTLWHELTHAMQAERVYARFPEGTDPSILIGAWSKVDRGVSYKQKSIEVEANEYAASFAHELPIARAA